MEEAWAYFRDIISVLTQTYVPYKQANSNKARNKHKWMTNLERWYKFTTRSRYRDCGIWWESKEDAEGFETRQVSRPRRYSSIATPECCRSYEVTRPLTILYNKSINSSLVSVDWRTANITPIYKKGPRNEPGNYRPVSLTSVVYKNSRANNQRAVNQLFWREGTDIIQTAWLCQSHVLFDEPTGSIWEMDWIPGCRKRHWYYICGLHKGFWYCSTRKIINETKLRQVGIRGKVFSWIKAFLRNREMRVIVNGHCSTWTQVISGVPQGSVIGPLLFVIYVNDLTDWIKSEMRIFADDTKVWKKITGIKDCMDLQEDLTNLQNWSDKWLLQFNAEKCKVMHVVHNITGTSTQ